MKTETTFPARRRPADVGKFTVYIVAILAVLLIGYILMHAMRAYVATPGVNAKRAEERAAGRAEVQAAAEKELRGDAAYLIKHNGIVRLPIDRAMQLVIENGKDQASFRSNLLARTEKAFKPAPAAPAAPAFE